MKQYQPVILFLFSAVVFPMSLLGQAQFGRISGKVIDQATNNGVAFVTVYLYLGDQQKLSARSNSGGNFSFVNVSPDVYTIRTSKPNYAEYSKQVRVNPNFTTKLYIPLAQAAEGGSKAVAVSDNVVTEVQKAPTEAVKTVSTTASPVVSQVETPAQQVSVAIPEPVTEPVAKPSEAAPAPQVTGTQEAAAQEMEVISNQDDQMIYEVTEVPAEIEGGFAALYKLIKYPEAAIIQKAEGSFVCRVNIDRDGNPGQIEVLKSCHPALDKAAQDAIFNVRYKPGKQGGNIVSSWLTVPVKFKLPK